MAVPDVREILRMLDEGRESEAIDRLEAALPRESTSAALRVLLARAYERVGRLAQAMDAWTTALFLAPESATARAGVRRMRKIYPELGGRKSEIAETNAPGDVATASDSAFGDAENGSAQPVTDAEPLEQDAPADVETADVASTAPVHEAGEEQLDRLIQELQGARIVPDPDFEFDEVELEDDDEGLVSETLARIYAAQQQYQEAAQVYEVLADQQPERADEFRLKAQEMKMRGRG